MSEKPVSSLLEEMLLDIAQCIVDTKKFEEAGNKKASARVTKAMQKLRRDAVNVRGIIFAKKSKM